MNELFKPLRLPSRVSIGLLILRFVAGLAFMYHGFGKIQNPFGWMGPQGFPPVLQALAALSEFGGGLAWILGMLTPLASLLLTCTMGVALSVHAFMLHDPFVASEAGKSSFEPAAGYLCIAILLLLSGPGSFSGDRLIFGEKG